MLCQQPFLPNLRPAGRVVAGAVYRAHLRLRLRCTRLLEIGVLAGRHLCAKAIGEETLLKNQSDGHLRLGCFPRFPCFPSIAVENTESGEVPGYWKLASLRNASFAPKQLEWPTTRKPGRAAAWRPARTPISSSPLRRSFSGGVGGEDVGGKNGV